MATRQGVPLERTVGRISDLGEGSEKELCTFHFVDGVLVLPSTESLEQGWSSVPKKVVASVCPQGKLRGTLCSCTLILGSKGAETTPWRNWAPTLCTTTCCVINLVSTRDRVPKWGPLISSPWGYGT